MLIQCSVLLRQLTQFSPLFHHVENIRKGVDVIAAVRILFKNVFKELLGLVKGCFPILKGAG